MSREITLILREAVGYKAPEKERICKNCRSYGVSRREASIPGIFVTFDERYISRCAYLEGLFCDKTNKMLMFEVDPEGTCNCFKKQPVRCERYNIQCCPRRKCSDPNYDDNCMEIT